MTKQYTYSFYARVTEKHLQLPNNKGYFAKWLNRWDILMGRYEVIDKLVWTIKSISIQADDKQLMEVIKVIEDTEHPLYQLIHEKYTTVYIGDALGLAESGSIWGKQLEHTKGIGATNYIKTASK